MKSYKVSSGIVDRVRDEVEKTDRSYIRARDIELDAHPPQIGKALRYLADETDLIECHATEHQGPNSYRVTDR